MSVDRMKKFMHLTRKTGIVLLALGSMFAFAQPVMAQQKATGLTATGTNTKGLSYNTFNRFTDNQALCDTAKRATGSACQDAAYRDEREFVRLRYVGRVEPDTLKSVEDVSGTNNPQHLNYTEKLQEGDVIRAYLYVHNNASTVPNDSRYEARDVRSTLSISGNKVLGTIKAKNAFFSEPTAEQAALYAQGQIPNVEATFQDDAFVQLPEGMSLAVMKGQSGVFGRVDGCTPGASFNTCTSTTLVSNPIPSGHAKVSIDGNTITYNHGSMVGSRPNAYTMVIDLIVMNSMGVAVTPPCTNTDYEATFRIFNPSSNNVLYVSRDPNWEKSGAFFSKKIPNQSEVKGPIGFDGNASGGKFRPGVTYYWAVHNGTSLYHGTPFKASNCNDTPDDNGREKPGSYPMCVLGTPVYRLVWDKAKSADVLTLELTRNGASVGTYTYTVYSEYGNVQTTSLRNASGQALELKAGDKIRWRVGTSAWYEATIQDCMNGQDGLRLDLNRMPACAQPTYNPIFLWNTPGRTKKLDVSTDPNFATYYTKDISNLTTTTGPEGFTYFEPRTDRVLSFQGDVTYYWRIREEGKIYPGQPFKVPKCVDVECDDNGYTGPNDQCDDDGNIIPQPECKPGVCACVDIDVRPGSAGDFNTATFVTKVSNLTTDQNQTVTRRAEIYNLRPDNKKGYDISRLWFQNNQQHSMSFDDTCIGGVNWRGATCTTKEQGSFDIQPTSVKAVIKNGPNRAKFADAASNPITVELDAFKADQKKPIVVRNLYPGDEVEIHTTGLVRTSKAGKEFAADTQSVDYNYYMKSPSNGGVKALTIARPVLMTINDGDQLRSFVLRGLASMNDVLKNVTGAKPPLISGHDEQSTSQGVSGHSLGFGANLSGLTVVSSINKTAGNTVTLSSEADLLTRMNIRPDRTRIFSASNQNVVLGSLSQDKIELGERSTLYVKFAGNQRGSVVINSDIVYKSGQQTPSFALVVENGDIVIHPRVNQLDGVFVVLGNGKIKGDANWQSYYTSGNEPKALLVNGALYGDIQELIPSRPNVALSATDLSSQALIKGSSIAVNFDGRIYSFPPPGLKEIVGGVYELLRDRR